MAKWHDAAPATDVVEDQILCCELNGVALALFRVGDDVFALHDLCTHGQARLSDGFIENGCVECPLHQGLVDIRTGLPRSAPITQPVRSYPARQVSDRIEILL